MTNDTQNTEGELECKYCGAVFPASIRHGCTLSDMRSDLRAEIEVLIATAHRKGQETAFNKIFEMAPKQNFEHWSKLDIANWFTALSDLETELKSSTEAD